MIVFDANRPIRRKADFEARSDRSAPAGPARLVVQDARSGDQAAVLIVRNGHAALCVPKQVLPGQADLAGEQAKGVGGGLVRQRRVEQVTFDPSRRLSWFLRGVQPRSEARSENGCPTLG